VSDSGDKRSIASQPTNSAWVQKAQSWAHVFACFLEHGANPNALTARHQELPGHPRLSPSEVVEDYFSPHLPEEAARLRLLLESKDTKIPDSEAGEVQKRENVVANIQTPSRFGDLTSWAWSWKNSKV
jgi:hypothetical protein